MRVPVVPIRRVAKLGSGHTPSRQHPEYWVNCTIPWLTLTDVGKLRDGIVTVVNETAEKISELGVARSAAVVHRAGTVALSRTASVGFTCILGTDMATSQDFATWDCGPLLEPKFLLYALRGNPAQIKQRMIGSTHKTIYMPDIETLTTPLPAVEQQRLIAHFLGFETARIDGLVAAKQAQFDALTELRGVTTEIAVVDGSVGERVKSTLAWAETIPAHWDEVKLTLVARLGSGHTPSRQRPEWWVDCVHPWITTGEVAQMRSDRFEVIFETREKISELGLANSSAVLQQAGTVTLCRTASAGYSAIMGREMATSQDFVTWVCGPLVRPRFLLLCLRAMRRDLLGRLAMGSTHQTIYMPDIESIRIPLPPIAEQDAIVERAWAKLRTIDISTDKIRRQNELLGERKQELITAAVTGQLDLARGIAEGAS